MPRLVTKFKFLPPGKKVGGYLKYIATREGVEKLDDSKRYAPVTKKQRELVEKILRDFPDAKEFPEYWDYLGSQAAGNASSFISQATDENADELGNRKTYADYIATRPRAERFGSHGLFTDDGVEVKLSKVSEELNRYEGNVYTAILSLRREDAQRLGFDSGSRWRDMLRTQTQALSENLKIPMEHLRWYAAFHNEGHHPHVHLIAYSTEPGEGYLSQQGVEKLRSALARDIFSQDLVQVYEQQTEYRNELRKVGQAQAAQLVASIHSGSGDNIVVENLLRKLSVELKTSPGKKVYAYLKPDQKKLVDEIMGELAKDERISALHDLWYEQREEVLKTYMDELPPRIPLAECPEFRPIQNAVIREVLHLGDEMEAEEPSIAPEVNENVHVEMPVKPVAEYDSEPAHPQSSDVLPASLRLLRQLAQALQEQIDWEHQQCIRVDRKLRRRIAEKKQAMGIHLE